MGGGGPSSCGATRGWCRTWKIARVATAWSEVARSRPPGGRGPMRAMSLADGVVGAVAVMAASVASSARRFTANASDEESASWRAAGVVACRRSVVSWARSWRRRSRLAAWAIGSCSWARRSGRDWWRWSSRRRSRPVGSRSTGKPPQVARADSRDTCGLQGERPGDADSDHAHRPASVASPAADPDACSSGRPDVSRVLRASPHDHEDGGSRH
jgi:hypothetical protein